MINKIASSVKIEKFVHNNFSKEYQPVEDQIREWIIKNHNSNIIDVKFTSTENDGRIYTIAYLFYQDQIWTS